MVDSIYSRFKTYVKATGAGYPNADQLPLLESTARDYPITRFLLRGRNRNRITGPANGFRTKIKWGIKKGYGPRIPGTPVTWQRRGSLEFLESHYCQEFGTMQFIEDEVKKQVGSVFSAESMAQQFDDILSNYMQDMYVDVTETIEERSLAVPTPLMEEGTEANVPRSIFVGMNEMKAGHGGVADGIFPGFTTVQGYDPTVPGAKMAANVVTYSALGKTDGSPGHLFEAVTRGLHEVNYKAVPLAEDYTQNTEGFNEMHSSLDGVLQMQSTLAAHDHVVAIEGRDNVFTTDVRYKGLTLVDVPDLENIAVCGDYDVAGAPIDISGNFVAGAEEQAYFTEQTSTSAGPRYYVGYQPHIRPIWDEENFQRRPEQGIYALDETIPDAMVTWIKNDRNLHFESFRRNLVIRPLTTIAI
ncbi:MAG: hypothetical protein AAF726_22320 [Planctomycetota bacterium]